MEKKCPSCGTWNTDQSVCTACNAPLEYWVQREQAVEKKEAEKAALPPTKLDTFIDGWRYHKWLLFRMIFWVFYSVWMVIFGIVTFFMMIIAWGPG